MLLDRVVNESAIVDHFSINAHLTVQIEIKIFIYSYFNDRTIHWACAGKRNKAAVIRYGS